MATAQPGIFAQGTRAHYHLEFDVRRRAGVRAVAEAVGRLREPAFGRTTPDALAAL